VLLADPLSIFGRVVAACTSTISIIAAVSPIPLSDQMDLRVLAALFSDAGQNSLNPSKFGPYPVVIAFFFLGLGVLFYHYLILRSLQ